jgi:glycosyltransferase involved in cell wall biosynthesis
MRLPCVSICLPLLNGRSFLEERMGTILSQTFTDWELIVCDSYSDDGSWEFLQKFRNDPRIHLFQVPREGLYAGWNECLKRAQGEYVYFAAADDTMTPDCLAMLVAPLERFPQIHIAVSDFQEIDEHGQSIASAPRAVHSFLGDWMHIPSIRNGMTEFLLHCAFGSTIWVTMTAVLFRRRLLDQIGNFRTDLGSKADEAWTLRASLASDVIYVPQKLATWRQHSGQATWKWGSREGSRVMCQCVCSVTADPASGIPSEWKNVHGWERALTAHHRHRVEQTFRLFRWAARSNPRRFVSDLIQAAVYCPGWFWRQAFRGFKAIETDDFDAIGHARQLIEMFGAEWPPKKIEAGQNQEF